MDLLNEPEFKTAYDKCKYVVKVWEHKFKKKHGRIPSKLDIHEADKQVREAYSTYFHMKTAALEQSFAEVLKPADVSLELDVSISHTNISKDIEEDDDQPKNTNKTWAPSLNKKIVSVPEPKTPSVAVAFSVAKLFNGSARVPKRNPRKSLNRSKSEITAKEETKENSKLPSSVISNSQPTEPTYRDDHIFPEKLTFLDASLPVVVTQAEPKAKPVNVLHKILGENVQTPTRKIDEGWLNRVQTGLNTKEISNNDSDSENIIYDSDEDLRQVKKPKIDVQNYSFVKKSFEYTPKTCSVRDDLNDLTRSELVVQTQQVATQHVKTIREQPVSKLKPQKQNTEAAATKSENYVRLNLKKKVFVRGKKNFKYTKYKKQQWKKKKDALCGAEMDMGGCDGDSLTCFKCGKTGHFARRCPNKKEDNLLPLEAAEEADKLPTLEEVSQSLTQNSKNENKTNLENVEIPPEDLNIEDLSNLNTEKSRLLGSYYNISNEDIRDAPAEVYEALHLFGHSSFRPGQEKAIMRVLSGLSTLVTLSTGSGKSLCYQLPAYLYASKFTCVTLVISPLVSLMDDQASTTASFLRIACWHTSQTPTQRKKIEKDIEDGKVQVLLVSPEAILSCDKSTGFGAIARKLPPIAFACIDEAHCVSQWSHNFRPSYLMVFKILRERLGVSTILGLTATSTCRTTKSIVEQLQIPDGLDGVISDIPVPDNIKLTVSSDPARDQALLELLTTPPFSEFGSIIIYCTRREECERVATFLRTCMDSRQSSGRKRKRISNQAECYHAGLSAAKRRAVQKAFMSGEIRIVVATVAFGLGINKADIRAVIHYNMPKNIESYVQEVGRAGRDGLPAHCHLFMDSEGRDLVELRRYICSNSMDRHVIRKLLQRVFPPCDCDDECSKHEIAFSIDKAVRYLDVPEENISTLLCYLELNNKLIEVLSPTYTVCKIVSYSGGQEILKAAESCLPLAAALKKYSANLESNIFEFTVVDVARSIGWQSGMFKHDLKKLEWNIVNGRPKRSTLNVQFSNLGFHIRSPGNLTDSELDATLDSLYQIVSAQEETLHHQLYALHEALKRIAKPSFHLCLEDQTQDLVLKNIIREYFKSEEPFENAKTATSTEPANVEQITADVRSLVTMYRENAFTGRAVARIFYGIQSPNYPAVMWGRCKFWRAHINTDFKILCKIATEEIIKMK